MLKTLTEAQKKKLERAHRIISRQRKLAGAILETVRLSRGQGADGTQGYLYKVHDGLHHAEYHLDHLLARCKGDVR